MTPGRLDWFSPQGQTATRALFRSLLRETTYFPDRRAQPVIRELVRRGFDSIERKVNSSLDISDDPSSDPPSQANPMIEKRVATRHRMAQSALRKLQAANAGEAKALTYVLSMAYGRRGVIRHRLVQELVYPSDPKKDGPVIPSTDFVGIPPALRNTRVLSSSSQTISYSISQTVNPRLYALAHSQANNPFSPSTSTRPLKKLKVSIPSLNSWQRSMPVRREIAATRRWWIDFLERLMPPLPEQDWEYLRSASLGETEWTGPVQRRPTAASDGISSANLTHDIPLSLAPVLTRRQAFTHFDSSKSPLAVRLQQTKNGDTLSSELFGAPAIGNAAESLFETLFFFHHTPHSRTSPPSSNPVIFTERTMRRAWGRVFSICPVLRRKEGQESASTIAAREWDVEWGASSLSKIRLDGVATPLWTHPAEERTVAKGRIPYSREEELSQKQTSTALPRITTAERDLMMVVK